MARAIFRYITALITETRLIAGLVDGEVTQDRIDLTNGITIEISTANFGSVRGYTVVAGLCDEIAFLTGDDSANPDTEILAALRPTMPLCCPARCCCARAARTYNGAPCLMPIGSLRPERCAGPDLANQHADDEPERASVCDRRGIRARPR